MNFRNADSKVSHDQQIILYQQFGHDQLEDS